MERVKVNPVVARLQELNELAVKTSEKNQDNENERQELVSDLLKDVYMSSIDAKIALQTAYGRHFLNVVTMEEKGFYPGLRQNPKFLDASDPINVKAVDKVFAACQENGYNAEKNVSSIYMGEPAPTTSTITIRW